MLDIQVDIQGEKVILNNLQSFADTLPKAVQRGLTRVAKGIHREAYEWLSGAGAKASNVPSGGYPVPVRSGHLRGHLNWLKPGETKAATEPSPLAESDSGKDPGFLVDGSFTAGDMEAVIYDSAIYSKAIHDGAGSSAKFGPRPFLVDALERFNKGSRIEEIMAEEIETEI